MPCGALCGFACPLLGYELRRLSPRGLGSAGIGCVASFQHSEIEVADGGALKADLDFRFWQLASSPAQEILDPYRESVRIKAPHRIEQGTGRQR